MLRFIVVAAALLLIIEIGLRLRRRYIEWLNLRAWHRRVISLAPIAPLTTVVPHRKVDRRWWARVLCIWGICGLLSATIEHSLGIALEALIFIAAAVFIAKARRKSVQ